VCEASTGKNETCLYTNISLIRNAQGNGRLDRIGPHIPSLPASWPTDSSLPRNTPPLVHTTCIHTLQNSGRPLYQSGSTLPKGASPSGSHASNSWRSACSASAGMPRLAEVHCPLVYRRRRARMRR